MEPNIEVLEATAEHVALMRACIRSSDASGALKLGMDPGHALYRCWRLSIVRRSAFIDGNIAAMWGLAGTLMGETGYPWFIASEAIESYPFRVAFRYRKELLEMLELFPALEDWVDAKHEKSVRMLELMGFELGNPQPHGRDGGMFIQAVKRA